MLNKREVKNIKNAFTLAEVLITLGIIGIVVALTLPTLIQNHRNQVVETRLKKFYSTINQAITLAEVDYGDRRNWHNTDDVDKDKNGNLVKGNTPNQKWLNKYIVPYIKIIASDKPSNFDNHVIINFADGSSLHEDQGSTNMTKWRFYPGDYKKCQKMYNQLGVCSFGFSYAPIQNSQDWKYVGRNFEPFKYRWDGSLNGLYMGTYEGCHSADNYFHTGYCTAIIQYNGWKIPKNYPFKVKY